ncbi:MAG: S8 family serine peptidase [Planctomycetota bacterium]|nr:S8 family serine peptidase [Planctomycetota bacterium]
MFRKLGVACVFVLAACSIVRGGALIPDDPYYPYAWHAPIIGLPDAWGYSTGSKDVIVAILDTGVISSEPDLAGRVLPALNVTGSGPTDPTRYRHGTWVASSLAMQINNGIGGTGVGNFSILPINVTAGEATTPEWIAAGIRAAADHGAKVINISLHALTYWQIDNAAAYARSKGALTFVAAGNDNQRNPMDAYDNLIFVAGTNRNDQRWVSSTNSSIGSTYGPYVDLSAPAESIVVADSIDTRLPDGYGVISGTSFAAPLAAGAAALAWSIAPNLTPDQVQAILFDTALKYADLGDPGWDEQFGWGRINVAAVAAAASATVPEPAALLYLAPAAFALFRRPRDSDTGT